MRLVTALRRIEAELRDLDSEAGKVMLRQIVLRVDVNEWRASKAPATISEIAQRHGADVADVSREMQPAFLAPSLVEQILDGRQPAALTANRLRRIGDLPLLWDEQAEALG
ncbi:hypothetical protein CNY89_02400 [Amaricoccus sp. HAR-UPW-R2A-40]|nr:hypothetical protein CNY89_02400 [Amaricoccus sp. HAR-UPW-R2A-40]